jgi:hypothetical protein
MVLRYRVLVFTGTPEEAGIAKLFSEYTGEGATK